ncbi:L-idonate 5-dehydrogenase [Nocardiopsis salina]|uniref:L-idonate 5-dehydrogenase n=1 Tax=Nocardiopsis salina TaxID=245836 RepID=UPI0003689533|nr:L-idonate 5-dehydrogenase [Nocardiopsis salina]
MKAVVVHGPADLRVDERPVPVPGPGQALIRVEWGGICGSDLSYVARGASGTSVLERPMVLGHEVAGRVEQVGSGVEGIPTGLRAAVMPATYPDGADLPERIAGRTNLHPGVRYLGSAGSDPHTDGGFAEYLVVRAEQLRTLPDCVDTRRGSLAEPLGVALHAVRRAESVLGGPLAGREVMVNGSGPIGLLITALLRHIGAGHVTATDVSPLSLSLAASVGADRTVDVTAQDVPSDIELVFEASGAAGSLGPVLRAVARGGVVVQVGNLPTTSVDAVLGDLVTREVTWAGSFRFVDEMTDAIEMLADGLVVDPVVTHEFDAASAREAFATAADGSAGSSKVLIRFD